MQTWKHLIKPGRQLTETAQCLRGPAKPVKPARQLTEPAQCWREPAKPARLLTEHAPDLTEPARDSTEPAKPVLSKNAAITLNVHRPVRNRRKEHVRLTIDQHI